jgi:hypothetical protein
MIDLIPGGAVTAWGVIALAILSILGYAGRLLFKAGSDAQKTKEAVARDKELDRIKQAAGIKPSGSMSSDPNNRDNRST